MVLGLALALAQFGPTSDALNRYLNQPQPKFETPKVTIKDRTYDIEFNSQKWQNLVWNHRILLTVPKGAEETKTAILYITGDGPRQGDYAELALISAATGVPVAMLFNIPNQPIENMREDDLIAHTFTKYLETGDENWPLLFPMTKAAVVAMDTVQKVAANNGMEFKNFVITGASKRGWTTWLTAASQDKRIAGIAPMVFDNLNFNVQMGKQMQYWGKYSPQIEDYTRRGLQAKLETLRGRELMAMVDPYSYLNKIRVPTLIVNGSKDEYWTVDAHKNYLGDLKQPWWLLEVPHSGHGLEDRARVAGTIGAFARAVAAGRSLPTLKVIPKIEKGVSSVTYSIETSERPVSLSYWRADAKERHFAFEKWKETKITDPASVKIDLSSDQWSAVFFEARFSAEGRSYVISSPVDVLQADSEQREKPH